MDYREFEETLCRLPAVDAARIVGDAEHITEVHILASAEKSPKQVVRDVQSLAMARFGAHIDRRIISVVQISPEALETVVGTGDRARIVGIREVPDGNRVTVQVTLNWHGEEAVGTSTGPSAASARMRLVGEATLRALEEALHGPPLALDAIGAPAIGMRHVVVAVVVSATPQGEEVAVGSSLAEDGEPESAVRAVLDALNRRIPQLLR